MDEQDDALGTPAGDVPDEPVAPATAADGWAVDAPRDPDGPRCPWCSAPLPDPAAERCAACWANLAASSEQPIPGVTTVDPDAVRAAAPSPKPRKRRSVLSWITGEMDLVDVPPPLPPVGRTGAAGPDAAAPGGPGPVAPVALGPASPDALAPPDARVRREMLRMELEALGLASDEGTEPATPTAAAADADDAAIAPTPGAADDPASDDAPSATSDDVPMRAAPPDPGTPGPT